jgi:hypothetical protein
MYLHVSCFSLWGSRLSGIALEDEPGVASGRSHDPALFGSPIKLTLSPHREALN